MKWHAGLCVAVVGTCCLLAGTSASAQDTLAPDQYEPNNSQSQARVIPDLRTTQATAERTWQSNFHDATDDADWYQLIIANESWFLLSPLPDYLGVDCFPQKQAFEVILSGIASGANYVLSLHNSGSNTTAQPPLPISATGNQNVRVSLQFQTSHCGSSERILIEVRRAEGVTVNEPYTLTLRAKLIMPPDPIITTISPVSGPIGTAVTITGNHLNAGPFVFSSSDPSYPGPKAIITASSPTAVTVTVPPYSVTGPIAAFTMVGGSTVSSQVFTVTSTSGMAPPPKKNGSATEVPVGTQRGRVNLGCCTAVVNPNLKGRLGRIVVAFPASAVPTGTRIVVFKNGAEVQADYGSHSFELLSGTYDMKIAGKMVPNVTVQAGHDTNVKVGVLRIAAAKHMRAAVLEGGKEIAGAYGGELIGLPAGSFDVQMAGQTGKVTISEGKITDF